jgi:hypothetical protein
LVLQPPDTLAARLVFSVTGVCGALEPFRRREACSQPCPSKRNVWVRRNNAGEPPKAVEEGLDAVRIVDPGIEDGLAAIGL